MKTKRDPTRKLPAVAGWFLRMMLNREDKSAILGDMEEEFNQIANELGEFSARIWYWKLILISIPYSLKNYISWSITMVINYMKIAFRNIIKHKGYSFINLTGLTIGITTFIIISIYVLFELSFDKYHVNTERIYRVIQDSPRAKGAQRGRFATTPPALAPVLQEEFPEIVLATRVAFISNLLVSRGNQNFTEPRIYFAEPETFKIFSIPFIKGDAESALKAPFSIVISERMSKKYFRNNNPMGKVLTIKEKYDFKVTGVFKDMPHNSHFVMDMILPFATYFEFKFTIDVLTEWSDYSSFYAYILIKEGANPGHLEAKFPALLNKYKYPNTKIDENLKIKYRLQALASIHLHSDAIVDLSTTNSDIKYIYIFTSIAFLILLIACINYMNLATARSIQRSKEVGLRKVVGASRAQLMRQFLGESLVYTLSATVLSLPLIWILIPGINNFVMRELSFNPLENPQILYILFSIVVLVGFLAGSYPALCISSFKPIATLRGVVRRGSRNISMRNLLVMLQFSFTIALIFGTIVIKDQLHFIKNKDMGYEKEQILVLHIGDIGTRNNFHKRIDTIKEALRKHPHILAVAGSKRLPNNINFDPINILPVRDSTEKSPTYAVWGDENFVDLYGIKIKEGRNFSKKFSSDRGGAILINETAAKVSKWKSPIGKEITYWGNRKGKIVGVMKDFHFHSLHRPIEALCIYYEPLYFDYLSIKIKPDNLSETINHISKTVKQFSPNHPFEYQFFDEVFERAYITEQRTGTLFNGFALLSIFLACLGLFGYVSFTAVQRTKEVGIRKVLGASVTHITLLFLKQFLIWVLIANFIAWPLAYYVMEKWLHNFVYRATIGLNTFLISSLLALFIAVGTIGYQSIKAAKANPVDSLRFQ